MALMSTMSDCFFNRGMESPLALRHHNQALRIINNRLMTPEAVNPSTISLINLLVVREMLQDKSSQAIMHFKGVRALVDLQGGLSQFEQFHALLLKICR
jgi:hypothetical protein